MFFKGITTLILVSAGLFVVQSASLHAQSTSTENDTIYIDGSSTVYPISEAVVQLYRKHSNGTQIQIDVSGTGGGFERFLEGNTDINNASRAINDAEKQTAASNNIDYRVFPIAYDGITLITHPANTFAESLTVQELKLIWEKGSSIKRWSQIREGWPDKPIQLYGGDQNSGTTDFFAGKLATSLRNDYEPYNDFNNLVESVASDSNALAFTGFGYYYRNHSRLKAIAINSGDGAIKPNLTTIKDRSYNLLSRQLYIYVNGESFKTKHVRSFIRFYLQSANAMVKAAGYVSMNKDYYRMQIENLASK